MWFAIYPKLNFSVKHISRFQIQFENFPKYITIQQKNKIKSSLLKKKYLIFLIIVLKIHFCKSTRKLHTNS